MYIKSVFLFLIFLTLKVFSQTAEEADFFIAQKPLEFEIFNRYQQKISSADKERFADFTPWKVLQKNALLGDQITHAMQVDNKGIVYYFILNSDGSFRGDPHSFHELFEKCNIVDDQIIVKLQNGVLFREVPFSNKSNVTRKYLEIGTHLNRLFKKGPSFFVENLQNKEYGWIRIHNESVIEIVKKEQQESITEFNPANIQQLEKEVSEINSVFVQLFSYLNSEYHENKRQPQWQIEKGQENIFLRLENIKPSKLRRSTSYFLNDIENIFTGEKVFITSTDTTITISLNDAE